MANMGIYTRRQALKGLGLGMLVTTAGPGLCRAALETATGAGRMPQGPSKRLWTPRTEPSNVAMVKGDDRREITLAALKKIEDEILTALQGKKHILVKPNFVQINRPLCATHVDAVRAILDFLRPHFKGPIVIGESTASRSGTFEGFKNYGYEPLRAEYGVELVDLNRQGHRMGYVFGGGNKPLPIRLIDTFFDPDVFIISAAKLKTR